jgi:methionine synthase II (cobalamin-independent)
MGTLAALKTAAWSIPEQYPSAKNIMFQAAEEFEKTIKRAEAAEARVAQLEAENAQLKAQHDTGTASIAKSAITIAQLRDRVTALESEVMYQHNLAAEMAE